MKNRIFTLPLFALTLLAFLSSPALADEKDDRIAELERNMRIMMQEIQTLKAERADEKQEQVALKEQISALEQHTAQQLANISPTAGSNDVTIDMGPGPKIKKGDFSWQPFGRIHLDAAHFDDDQVDHPSGAEFRRARLGMKGTVAKDLGYKVEVDFANEGVNFKDVYLNYTGFDNTNIRVGSIKPPMGMEELTSANSIPLIERSAVTSAFGTSEIIGLGIDYAGKTWSLHGGVYNDDPGTQSTDDEAFNLTARGTWAPVHTDDTSLHLGASVSHREPDQADNTFDFDARAENAIQSADSVSAVITTADSAELYSFEAGGSWGPVYAQGEYYNVSVDNTAGADPDFGGGYIQAAWTLTGEHRPYSPGKGTFGAIAPDRPFNPSSGDWGAWELAARYSHLDLSDGTTLGGEMDNYTAGLNWYLNKNVRLMFNYISVDTDQNAVTANDDPQIFLMRTQGVF